MKSIEVKNLKKQFKTLEAVKGINFSINQNETLALLGPNGCGKTTTIGMLLGLITPTSGNIFINEQELNYKDHQFLNIMNFASPYVELPKKLTVLENLKVYGRMYLIKNFKEKIDQLIEDLNLKSFLNKRTGELSSGQKNRVSLAKSLINDPKILLLDEPTASLDPDTGDYVRSYLEKYKKENDISILLASHNMSEVTRLSDYVLMMKEGQIIDHGKAKDLIDKHGRENLEQVFLKLVREKNEY
jgi:ABC-2 type transport system ATP-binding protein